MTPIQVEQFEIVKHTMTTHIPKDLWNMVVEAEEVADFVGDMISIRCSWESASKVAKNVIEVPADWWQHFKLRFAPGWFLARWPTVMTTYHARGFCPDVQVPPPDGHRRFGAFEVAYQADHDADYQVEVAP